MVKYIFVWIGATMAAFLTILAIGAFAVFPMVLAILYDNNYWALPVPITGLISAWLWFKLFKWIGKKEKEMNA